MKQVCFLFLLILCSATKAFTQSKDAASAELKAGQDFHFLSTAKTATFDKELNDRAKQGYRFVRLAKSFNQTGLSGLLSRKPVAAGEPPKAQYEYKVLATNRLVTMKKELEEAAAAGYEFRGITTQDKWAPFTYPETIVVMERPLGAAQRRFDYRFLSTQREKTMQKELDAAVSEGFTPLEMIFGEDTNTFSVLFGSGFNFKATVIMSRAANNPGAEMGKREYRYLSTAKVSTMEKELNQLAKEGFEFQLTSIGSLTIMARPLNDQTPRYEYKLLATRRTGTMQKELTETGQQGYQFLGASTGAGGLVSVMERGVKEDRRRPYDYKFIAATLESTTQQELNEALAANYKFIEISLLGEKLIVLGKVLEVK